MTTKKITIKKTQVIRAILDEPLKAGDWIYLDEQLSMTDPKAQVCEVCAVGAVLRERLSGVEMTVDDFHRLCGEVADQSTSKIQPSFRAQPGSAGFDYDLFKKHIDNKLYMGALSNAFEGLWWDAYARSGPMREMSRHQVYRIRKRLVKLVQEHFPSRFTVTVEV